MRSHAKASCVGSTLRQAGEFGLIGREGFLRRYASLGSSGSGAPAGRRAAGLGLVLLALLAVTSVAQAKVVVGGFGAEPNHVGGPPFTTAYGGQFAAGESVRGVAVNTSGVGAPQGTFYVIDPRNRVQRFSPSGAFQRLWGEDVVSPSVDELQKLVIDANGGSFALTFDGVTTEPIPYDPSQPIFFYAARVREKLAKLPAIGDEFSVYGGSEGDDTITVQFAGPLEGEDLPQLTADTSQLTGANGPGTIEVSTIADGADAAETGGASTGFEICTVAVHCQGGATSSSTGNGGQANDPRGIAVNQANGHVYLAEQGNRRVSEFDADGNFVRAWGWDVIVAGEPNDTGTGFEICEVASECQPGEAGESGGQLGFEIGYPVTDSANNVWVPDPANRRIQEFSPSGHFVAAYGYDVDTVGGGGAIESCSSIVAGACQAGTSGSDSGQFAFGSPSQLAIDASGNVFAIDSGNARVQKFNSTFTTASNFAASSFSTYTSEAPRLVTATQGGTRLAFAVFNNLNANEDELLELDAADGSVKDTSLIGSELNYFGEASIDGLTESPISGSLYATTHSSGSPFKLLEFGAPQPPLALAVNPVTSKTDTTATFSATANPQGGLIGSCKFQYSTDQITWTDVPASDCRSLKPDGGFQPIVETAGGLDPNTHYFVRFVASRPLVPSSTVISPVRSFDTDAVPPVVTDVGAVTISNISARLVGTVDPRNSETGYAFQYGTTPGLGSTTTPLALGDGVEPITVSQVVDGLSPDTTYYFRLVATNLSGTTASPSHTLHTRSEPLPLPKNRRWEMVSPPDKNLGSADKLAGIAFPQAAASQTGEAVGFCSSSLFGEPSGQQSFWCAPYLSRRSNSGWETETASPHLCGRDFYTGILAPQFTFLSSDYDHAVLANSESPLCSIPPLDPAAPLSNSELALNLYRVNPSAAPSAVDLLAPNFDASSMEFDGGSDDFSHIVYTSLHNQTSPPDSPASTAAFKRLYEWNEGALRLVSVNTDNEPFEASSSFPGIHVQGSSFNAPSAVSRDGSRIYFQNPAPPNTPGYGRCALGCELYLREGGASTLDVSASECTSSCGSDGEVDTFLWATPDGGQALFGSCSKLTDASAPTAACGSNGSELGDGSKLYRWDRSGVPSHRLIDLSADHEANDGVQPGVLGLIGSSDDGEVVYFAAAGQIVSGAPTGSGAKLYRWTGASGDVEYLGSIATGDYRNWSLAFRNVTPDGKYLLISTESRLEPVVDRDSDRDILRWDAANGWSCVSCQRPGDPSTGDASDNAGITLQNNASALKSYSPVITMTNDGRVFFDTPDPLVSEDVNGDAGCAPEPLPEFFFYNFVEVHSCQDVYEWDEGAVHLISSGVGSTPSYMLATTPAGGDVFFFTRQRLVGWDVDDGTDVYDARLDGGFPEPPVQPPACDATAGCRGAGTAIPPATGAGTAVFQGPGNPTAKRPKARKHRKPRRHGKKRSHRGKQRANDDRRAGR